MDTTLDRYEVHIGEICRVWTGNNREAALALARDYAELSRIGYGRAAGEDVTVLDTHRHRAIFEYVGHYAALGVRSTHLC